jgi:hypothetical protein
VLNKHFFCAKSVTQKCGIKHGEKYDEQETRDFNSPYDFTIVGGDVMSKIRIGTIKIANIKLISVKSGGVGFNPKQEGWKPLLAYVERLNAHMRIG